jgi:hypothetical protein
MRKEKRQIVKWLIRQAVEVVQIVEIVEVVSHRDQLYP